MSDNYRSRQERRKAQEKTNQKSKSKSKNKTKKPLWRKIMIVILIAGLLLVGAGAAGAAVIISGAPALDPDELVFSQAAEIYDQNDEQVTRLQSGENRDLIDIEELPDHAKAAFIAVEDVRFYDHFGIDIKRIFGAIAANITEGFGAEGASTITQQVVRNALLSQEKTISRKVQEQYLAIKLEQQYSKSQILEMYLNLIYFNKGAYGIGEAAKVYFNKSDISQLTIEDAALLAAIPRRPSYYDPTVNPDAAEERRNMIIDFMVEHGFISETDGENAKSVSVEEQIDFNPPKEQAIYDSFITQIHSELEEIDGITTSDLYSSGLKIYTTLDTNAQEYAENVIQTNDYISNYPDNEDFQVGFTLLDTNTGAIKAMVGNRQNPDVARGFNYAARSSAQPGSTLKPVIDYGPAIEYNQWSTFHQIEDSPHEYSDGTPIRNYTGTYSGNVSMREALVRSLNIPAVKALQQTGLERAGSFARDLGISIDTVYESHALGAVPGVSSLDMAGSFAAFGNGGTFTEPYTVRKIEFPDGRVMNLEPSSKKVMKDYTAYMITDMLKDVVTRGTGTSANIEGLPVAGKTGTTNFTDEEHQKYNIPWGGDPDVWFTGYTPRYTAAVWTGFSGARGKNYLTDSQNDIAMNIFRLIMSHVSKNKDTPDFQKPDSVVEIAIDKNTGQRASAYTPASETVVELFVKGTGPETISQEHFTPNQITGLNALYDEESDAIQVTWNYEDQNVSGQSFVIEHQVDNDGYQALSTQSSTGYTLSSPVKGSTHSFRITVLDDEGSSSSSSEIQVNVPAGNEEDEEDEENADQEEGNEEDTDETENSETNGEDPGNNQGQDGNNPGDGNGENNGDSGEDGDNNENSNGNNNSPPENGNTNGQNPNENGGNNPDNNANSGSSNSIANFLFPAGRLVS